LPRHPSARRRDADRLSAPDRWAEALVDPVEPIVVTRIFEALAG
jgi:hypothetical protein